MVYRGPVERARLATLLLAAQATGRQITFAWLNTRALTADFLGRFVDFIRRFDGVRWEVLNGSLGFAVRTRARLMELLQPGEPVFAIGASALPFAAALGRRPLLWSINGIPEEAGTHSTSLRTSAGVEARWRLMRAMPSPDLVVTVSARMSNLVKERGIGRAFIAVPLVVDLDTFVDLGRARTIAHAYQGWGAPWQNLDETAAIWRAIAARSPEARFRVISRDPRCRVLVDGIVPSRVDVVGVETPGEVNALLNDVQCGSLFRRPGVINEVAFPTKFGEYLGAGCAVMTTRLGWDLSEIVERSGCGVLVQPGTPPDVAAASIEAFRASLPAPRALRRAAHQLDQASAVASLSLAIQKVVNSG
jgi:glycosyltransferase involved in cell wall biosynthesis